MSGLNGEHSVMKKPMLIPPVLVEPKTLFSMVQTYPQ